MLSNTVTIDAFDLYRSTDPVKVVYDRLMDAGAPIQADGSFSGEGVEGFASWTCDGSKLCFSWGPINAKD